MFSLFGKKKESKSPVKVIHDLRETLQQQEKREIYLGKQIEKNKEEAREAIRGKPPNKQKAVYILKKNKLLEKELGCLYGMKENIEVQIFTLEQSINNKNTVNAMKNGKDAISVISKDLDPNDIAELIDDISESLSITDEIGNTLSKPIGTVYDDAELLLELDELEKLSENREEPDHTQSYINNMPNVPTKKIISKKDVEKEQEDEELKKLTELMS
jgi:ABC-type antimicrobial peptide transport system permease subunit